jgi:hypothetical protein
MSPKPKALKGRVRNGIDRGILANIEPGASTARPTVGGWQIASVFIDNPQLQDDAIVGRTLIVGERGAAPDKQEFRTLFTLRILRANPTAPYTRLPRRPKNKNEPLVAIHRAEIIGVEVQTVPIDLDQKSMPGVSELLPCRSLPQQGTTCVELDEDAEADLDELAQLLSGLPDPGIDNFFRMLYFSVVTITTVGFGDIVPVTQRARGLVTFEAFLGPVVLGFFLAAIGSRLSDSSVVKISR